jgi:ABC-type multidrug transport system fused ATPase/permease subunit
MRPATNTAAYLTRLLRYARAKHPFLLANAALGLVSVSLELVAMASVLPLSLLAAGERLPAEGAWARIYGVLGAEPAFPAALMFFLAAFALRLLTQFASQAIAVRVGKRVQAELSSHAFGTIVRDLSLREIDDKSAGHFIALAGDETARAGAIVTTLNELPAAAFLVLLYLGTTLAFSWRLGLAVLVFLGIVLLCLRNTLRQSQLLGERQLGEAKIAHSIFLDTLNGLRSVRALSAEAFVTAKYEDIIHRYTTTHYLIELLKFAARLVPAIVLIACAVIATGAGRLAVAHPSELALVVTGLAFLLRFFPAAGNLLSLLMFLATNVRGASDVTHLLETAPHQEQAGAQRLDAPVHTVEFRAVHFGYRPGAPVLRDFSAVLRKGRSYALVGPSGAGKTTLFDLMLGFYPPDAGEVCVNGVPVPRIENPWLRAHVVLVGQQITVFNDTIANNVRFGAGASDAVLRSACQAALVDEFAQGFPAGFETLLSFQGANLSGGQRQRIGIARGLLRDADVLLLDESTAGLDAEARDRIADNILRLYADRIVVFATHDKDLMSRVDEVIALEGYDKSSPAAATRST